MLALVFSCLSLPFMLLLVIIPESPVFLVSRKRLEEAGKQLRRLRGPAWDVAKETSDILKNLQGVTESDTSKDSKKTSLTGEFFQPHVLKPLLVSICLMFFFQCSGINLIMIYAPAIFMEVTNIDAFTANIMMGMSLLAANILTLVIAGKCPRRIMLLVSSLGCSITLAIMGVSYQVRATMSVM